MGVVSYSHSLVSFVEKIFEYAVISVGTTLCKKDCGLTELFHYTLKVSSCLDPVFFRTYVLLCALFYVISNDWMIFKNHFVQLFLGVFLIQLR